VCAKSLAASESTVGQVNGLGIRTSSLVPFALSQSIQAPKSNPPTALPFKCPCAPAEGLSFPIFVALVRPAPATTAMRFCLSANQQPASGCGRKPSSDSPPLHRPWSRCKRGRNSVPTTRTDMSNVTSRGNYISSSYGADRPCEHLNSCDIIIDIILQEHEHSVVYTSLLPVPCDAIYPPAIEHPPSVCVRDRQHKGPSHQIPGIAVSQHPSISQTP
jgi:hypothetical protein